MASRHSHLVGGSTAARIINCPASWGLTRKIPIAVRDVSSEYADYGTRMHAVMEAYVNDEPLPPIDDEDAVDCINPAIQLLDDLLGDGWKDRFTIFGTEVEVEVRSLPGAYGTIDLVVYNEAEIHLIDFKFGAGISVYIRNEDGTTNEQLLFYAAGLFHMKPDLFKGRDVYLSIVQPRTEVGLDTASVDVIDIIDFESKLRGAVIEAINDRTPHMEIGKWCQFAPCKTICPLHTAPMLSVAELPPALKIALTASVAPEKRQEFGELLGHALTLGSIIEPVLETYRKIAHQYLEDGGSIPGYKLVPKRASRKWVDEAKAEAFARRNGVDPIIKKTASPAQLETLLKPQKIKLEPGMTISVSSGNTITAEDDARLSVSPADISRVFAETLRGVLAAPEPAALPPAASNGGLDEGKWK